MAERESYGHLVNKLKIKEISLLQDLLNPQVFLFCKYLREVECTALAKIILTIKSIYLFQAWNGTNFSVKYTSGNVKLRFNFFLSYLPANF